MVASAQREPEGIEHQFSRTATADGPWRLVMEMSSDRDRTFYLDKEFGDAYLGCLRHGFSQGPQGYARDLVNALRPWSFRVEDIAIPVDLWYGGLDTSPVHSPDLGATLSSRLSHGTLTVDPGEGSCILWTRAPDILARLKSRLP
jgi:hypothetical protein